MGGVMGHRYVQEALTMVPQPSSWSSFSLLP